MALLVVVLAVWGDSIGHQFVFDDWSLVIENEVVTWSPMRASALLGFVPGSITYRPVRIFSYMVDHAVAGGLDPAFFHASNLVFHALTVLTLYALAFALLGSIAAAWFAAALFAVHPLGAESVAYVSGRRDLLCGWFSLLSLLAWWSFLGDRGSPRPIGQSLLLLLGAGGAALLALGSKESAATLPALCLLLVVLWTRRDPSPPSTGQTVGIAAGLVLGLLLLVLAVSRIYLPSLPIGLGILEMEPLAPQPALTLQVLARYARLAVLPLGLSADYRPPAWPLPATGWDLVAAGNLFVLLVSVGVGVWLLWRGRAAGLGILWFFVALAPVSQIFPYAEILSEHNTYLPLAGLVLAAGDWSRGWVARQPVATVVVAAFLVGALAVSAHARSSIWADDRTLWAATIEERPGSIRGRYNLGLWLARARRLEEARDVFLETVRRSPGEVDVLQSLATVQGRLGNEAAAIEAAERAVETRRDAPGLSFLAVVYLSSGDERRARQAFAEALDLDPDSHEARAGLLQIETMQAQRRVGRSGEP